MRYLLFYFTIHSIKIWEHTKQLISWLVFNVECKNNIHSDKWNNSILYFSAFIQIQSANIHQVITYLNKKIDKKGIILINGIKSDT